MTRGIILLFQIARFLAIWRGPPGDLFKLQKIWKDFQIFAETVRCLIASHKATGIVEKRSLDIHYMPNDISDAFLPKNDLHSHKIVHVVTVH